MKFGHFLMWIPHERDMWQKGFISKNGWLLMAPNETPENESSGRTNNKNNTCFPHDLIRNCVCWCVVFSYFLQFEWVTTNKNNKMSVQVIKLTPMRKWVFKFYFWPSYVKWIISYQIVFMNFFYRSTSKITFWNGQIKK